MEDFDKFVQRCASCLSKNNDSAKPSSATSVIRFYGHPILPPLLTEAKRVEMQQHREEAQTAAVHRRTKASAQPAHVRATLHREQLCQAPTLEGLLHESESDEKSPPSHDSSGGSVLRDCPFTGTNERLLFSSPPEEKENDESHFSAAECEHHLLFPPVCGHDKDHNFDRRGGSSDNPDLSDALSTNHSPAADLHTGQEPTENKSERNVDLGEVEGSLRPFSELLQEGGGKNDASLLPVTLLVPSPSASKENDGASVPPLEVTTSRALHAAPQTEYLEKCLITSGQQVSHPNCLRGLSHQPAIRDDLETTTAASGGSEGKDRHIFASPEGAYGVGSVFQHGPSNTIAKTPNIICYPPLNGDELERNGLESWLGYGFAISKGISHSLVMPDFLVDGKCEPRLCSAERKDDPPLPSAINYNRDHNAELLQSLTSPQSPAVQRHPALTQSDKAKPPCINLQALLKRSQEYRQQQQMLRNKGKNREVQEKSPEPARARTDQPSLSGKKSNEFGEIQEEPTIKSDISQEVTMKPEQTSSSPQQRYKGSRKCNMTRAATFSQTPVYRKSGNTKSSRQFEESGLGNDAGGNGFDKRRQVNEETIDHQAASTPDLFTVDASIAGALPNHSATSSDHNIDLIESNLCGLKAQILDLESTLKDRLEDHSPNESDMNLELECEKGTRHVTNSDTKCLRRQLLKEMINAEENPGPGPSDGHDDLLAPHDAQQDQISEVSQNVSSETEVSSGFLVWPHAADHSGQNEATGGCRCGQPRGHPSLENPSTPETGDEFQGWGSALGPSPGLKTSILMRQGCQKCGQVLEKQSAAHWPEGDGSGGGEDQQEQDHIARVRSLQEEHSRQEEELLQPGVAPPQCFRPLLLAAAKGFLTRRLLKTERVKKLVDVIRDMQQLLNTLQQPNSLRKEIVTLKALLHLNAARSEISEIFFDMSAGARMQIISQDRELIRERGLGGKSEQTGRPRRKSCLSAATQKSLERKRERLMAAIKSKATSQGQLKANCVRF